MDHISIIPFIMGIFGIGKSQLLLESAAEYYRGRKNFVGITSDFYP